MVSFLVMSWFLLRWITAGYGLFLWIMYWTDRAVWLGVSQVIIVSVLLRRELPLDFARHRPEHQSHRPFDTGR